MVAGLPGGLKSFEVTDPIPACGRWRDTMPGKRDPVAYTIYIKARKLWRSKPDWEMTHTEATQILADVTYAANQGDWGAMALLANFYRDGLGSLKWNNVLEENQDKAVEISRQAVKAGQAWGYYDLGVAYEYGYGTLVPNREIAWAYYLKAAELGSPYAQMTLAEAYSDARRWDGHNHMLKCAYTQQHGPAAYELAMYAEIQKKYLEAALYYQDGIKFGDKKSADAFSLVFAGEDLDFAGKMEILAAMEGNEDAERVRRYKEVSHALAANPDLRFGRLDEVLPLPPKHLPPWNGVQDALTPEPEGPPTY